MLFWVVCHSESSGRHSDPEPCEGEESQYKPCGEPVESIREESISKISAMKFFKYFFFVPFQNEIKNGYFARD